MRLSKTGYYTDFVIYAAVLITASVATAWHDTGYEMSLWLLAAAVGAMFWSLAEYVLHRFVLHQIAPFAAMHDAHHRAPPALIGTPTWLFGTALNATARFKPSSQLARAARVAYYKPEASGRGE
jgi:hypothetical protein